MIIDLHHARRRSRQWEIAYADIESGHYLGCMPDTRTSFELFVATIDDRHAGVLVFGRPQATRCGAWYGSVADWLSGRCEATRWQVLNVSRVWIDPTFQAGGQLCNPGGVPGFRDRKGRWRSTLASDLLRLANFRVGFAYLCHRPPCFLNEPYQIKWLMSYCDTNIHKGTIYREAGWELYSTNARGIQTWRSLMPLLTDEQDTIVRGIAEANPRAIRYRAERAQLGLGV